MNMVLEERHAPPPTVTIQPTVSFTAALFGDILCLHFSTSDAIFEAADKAFQNGDDTLAVTGISDSFYYVSLFSNISG